MVNGFVDLFERLFETGGLFCRVVAILFLLSFFYVIIFGKGLESTDSFICGFAFAWSLQQLFANFKEEPRRKRLGR